MLEDTFRSNDADAHEMAPSHLWHELFGPGAGQIAKLLENTLKGLGANDFYNPTLEGDLLEISDSNVWNVRGTRAPSAFDFGRRIDVMDKMGIERQLIFPSFALMASAMMTASENYVRDKWKLDLPLEEVRSIGRQGVNEYNEWAVRITALAPDRLRPVGFIVDDGTVEDLMRQTKELVAKGIRAINIPGGTPPGGVSPADAQLDPYWEFLEKNNIPVVLHVGGELGFLKTSVWGKAPAFAPGKVESHELGLEPYSFATMHYPASNFLTVLTLGGVFERFPGLRFGIIETGCTWLGPLAEHLDMWARDVYAKRLAPFISKLPSEYFASNVRVTPFNNFEHVEMDFERYPNLANCYCYSTDYPHIEGGTDIKRMFQEKLAPLGEDIMDKFFYRNALLLLP